ncbi:hypothetical protein BDZ90DRAFT_232583 [Jaminaea rosea]|uniref:HMG box domain-containing protein n=1 Tax=Jaminaea rosea TaxID=1569628 RepID=A0A316UNZ8_9BASI|nr:hypothetical protein BDZ90DRAFT_232583 [Jaminaea rosea]PWN27006.1 hypothetical protein BDZ90DRAFT_232583 [Jaminaea rosea]
MSQRIEKGAPRFKPGMGAGGPPKRKQLGMTGGRAPIAPPAGAARRTPGAMSPPPVAPAQIASSPATHQPTRSYAHAAPTTSSSSAAGGTAGSRASATTGPSSAGGISFKAPTLKPRTPGTTAGSAFTPRARPTPTPSVVDDEGANQTATPVPSEGRPRTSFAPGSSSMFAPRAQAPAATNKAPLGSRASAAGSPPPLAATAGRQKSATPLARAMAASPPRSEAIPPAQGQRQAEAGPSTAASKAMSPPPPRSKSFAPRAMSPPAARSASFAPRAMSPPRPSQVQPAPSVMVPPQLPPSASASTSKARRTSNENDDQAESQVASSADPSQPSAPKRQSLSQSTSASQVPPSYPNKPPQPYFLFQAERRPALRQEHPQASMSELSKLLGAEWKAMSSEGKDQFKRLHAEKTREFETQVEEWISQNPEQASQMSEKQKGKKRTKPSAILPEGVAPPPKKAPSAYFLFAQGCRENAKEAAAAEARGSDADDDDNEAAGESSTANGKTKKKKRRRSSTLGPGPSAREIGDKWRLLPLEERQTYLHQAKQYRIRYKRDLSAWRQEHPEVAAQLGLHEDGDDEDDGAESEVSEGGTHHRRKKRKRSAAKHKNTASDDEREYQALVAEHGPSLAATRLDASSTMMTDIAGDGNDYNSKRGRASDRTFELDRIREGQLAEQRAARNANKQSLEAVRNELKERLRRAREGERVELPTREEAERRREMVEQERSANGDEDEEDVEDELGGRPQDRRRQQEAFTGVGDLDATSASGAISDREGDGDEEEVETLDGGGSTSARRPSNAGTDAASDAGSARTATTMGTHHSLRENAQAPQMRIVDGQIVVDQSSLTINRNEETIFEEADMVEEVAGHRFVNSATHSKRGRLTAAANATNGKGAAATATKAAAAAATAKWSAGETDEFYRAVSMWGTDFEMISRMFPARTRKQIKAKWTREDRANPRKLDDAFRRKVSVKLDEYALMANVDLSGPAPEVKVEMRPQEKKEEEEPDEDVVDEGEEGGDAGAKSRKISQTPDPLASGRGRRGSSVASARSGTAGAGGDAGPSRSSRHRSAASDADDRQERERRRRRREEAEAGPDEEEVVDLPSDM